jgi:ATP-binding cassette subfamily C protein
VNVQAEAWTYLRGKGAYLKSLRKFIGLLWRSARWQLVAALALSMLLSLTEGVSLAMVFPLIALLGGNGSGSTAAVGPRTQFLFHVLTIGHVPRSSWLGAVLVVVLVSVGLLTQLNGMLTTMTVSIILPVRRNLAAEIYEAILHADWTFLTRRKSSDLTHFLTTEMARVGTLASNLIALMSNAMVGLLLLGVAFVYAPLLTVLLLACFGLLIPWQRGAGKAIYRSGRETSVRMGQVFESSMERLQNLKVVKAYGAQDAELKLFTRRYSELIDELIANQWRSVASSRRFQMVSLALLCGLILVGLNTLHLAPAAMLIFLFAFVRATPRVNAVQSKVNEILSDLPAYTHIEAFLAECAANSEAGDGDAPAPSLTRELTLRRVAFAYGPGLPMVLDGIDLTLPAGRITAIAGLSGAGKSTVADLAMGLLVPDSGSVEADGESITRANARSWRRRIGYVSQDTLLFHDTIRANLLWALPSATDAQLAEAIEAASAQFVYGLANGIETVVGDRGMMLSHGQRQRIALARALLLKPVLLILDEATNSLDLENEENILNVLKSVSGVTTLLISHRPSAVRVADRVYVLERGRVKLSGSWDEVKGEVEAQAAGTG